MQVSRFGGRPGSRVTLLRGPLFVTGVKKLDDKEERKHVVYPRFVWSEAHVHTYIRAHSHTDARTHTEEGGDVLGSELGDLERAFPSGASSRDARPREASLQSRVTEPDGALSSRPRPGPRVTSHPAAG